VLPTRLKTGGATSNKTNLHHHRFLCAALTDPSPPALRPYLDDELWDWEVLFRLASDERILPLLHDRLVDALDLQPGAIAEVLRDIRDRHAQRNEIIFEELQVLGCLANQIGVEPVVLKGGAHLLGKLYAASSDRFLIDIDLLVPEPAIPTLVDHLLKNGYASQPRNTVPVDSHHEPKLTRPGRPCVEVHNSLGMGRARVSLPPADVIRDSIPILYRGVRLRLPSDEHLLIHQAIHAQLNHSYRDAIWPSLRTAYDCRLLLARLAASGRLPVFLERCANRKGLTVVDVHLRTIQELTGELAPLPALHLFSAAHVRWLHRRLLRAAPGLCFVDPYFFVRSSVMYRLYRLKDLVRSGKGLRSVLRAPFRLELYKNIFDDLF
jgi:hypothetical protein